MSGWDPVRLEKFFLSVLWRASLSDQKLFELIDLGPLEPRLRDHLWSDAPDHENFGCVLSQFKKSEVVPNLEKSIRAPGLTTRIQGVNYCKLYLPGYTVLIRVDKRQPTGVLSAAEMSADRPVLIVNMPFDGSREFAEIWNTV